MLDKPVSRKVLKLVTSGTCRLFLNYSIDINSSLGLADAAVVSESDSSASESCSRSSSGSSSAEESRSATSLNSKSSKSKSIKDKRYEQIKQANAARRKESLIQKPEGMTLARFYKELAQNPVGFSVTTKK